LRRPACLSLKVSAGAAAAEEGRAQLGLGVTPVSPSDPTHPKVT